jgi:hypothetical protein
MTKSAGLSLVAAALIGAGLVSVLEDGRPATTPFWQLHGAAPAAAETDALVQLRQAARSDTLVAGLP